MSPGKTEVALRQACGTWDPLATPQHCLYPPCLDSRRQAQPASHRPPDAPQCGRSLFTGARLRPRCTQPSRILGRKLLTHTVPPSRYSTQSALGDRGRMCIQCVILKMGTDVTLSHPHYQSTAAISAKLDHLNQTDRLGWVVPPPVYMEPLPTSTEFTIFISTRNHSHSGNLLTMPPT